jgi:predicted enzyme related to lactoylglutathione lyase
MANIVHFDLPADDLERARKFYTQLFDWKIEKAPGPMEYFFIETTDEKGNKGVAGGMGKRGSPEQRITNYIGVDSVDEYMKKVEELGGKLVGEKMTVPGFGYLAVCMDTEGNTFGLWQVNSEAKG